MLRSLINRHYSYIGKEKNIDKRIDAHIAASRSNETRLQALYPYGLFSFIRGFNGDNHLIYYIEENWKETRDNLISKGIQDPREFARRGNKSNNVSHSIFYSPMSAMNCNWFYFLDD